MWIMADPIINIHQRIAQEKEETQCVHVNFEQHQIQTDGIYIWLDQL